MIAYSAAKSSRSPTGTGSICGKKFSTKPLGNRGQAAFSAWPSHLRARSSSPKRGQARLRFRCASRGGGDRPGGLAGELPVAHDPLPVPAMRRGVDPVGASWLPLIVARARGFGKAARGRCSIAPVRGLWLRGGLVPRARARGYPTGAAVRRLPEAGRAVRPGHGAGRGWAAGRDSGGAAVAVGGQAAPQPGRGAKSRLRLARKNVTF